ncbi:MAG: hypothetical protein J3K34DRAFT_520120 [Monoraphidium minutum]|nr:MAG: hypothetical protein J3K34DRAFT_520120 [Monoraphidium minutum]
MKAAQYQRSSSLARKFVSDFPSEADVPLQLPPEQAAAFEGHVRPLLDLAERADPTVADGDALRALRALLAALEARPGAYLALRGAADYVQCVFAQCVVDAAAAFALDGDRAAFLRGLSASCPAAADDALLLELRARLVAAGAADLTAPLTRSLRAAAAAAPAGGLDAVAEDGGGGDAAAPLRAALPFRGVAAAARGDGFQLPGGRVAWPALRRSLAAASGRYLEPVLGEVGGGGAKIVVSGGALMAALLGAHNPPALEAAHHVGAGGAAAAAGASSPVPGGADVCAAARWFDLSLVGACDLEAAAGGVEDYARELLTRHKMRHLDAPLADASGRPLAPLLLLTRRALIALLPEAVHGAGGGGAGVRDVGFRLRLQGYRDPEELLLAVAPPRPDLSDGLPPEARALSARDAALAAEPDPAPADAWGEGAAFDGDDAWVLPGGGRALATGRAPVDPGRLRAAAAGVVASLGGGGGGGGGDDDAEGEGPEGRERAAAVALVRALAQRGWEPEAPLPAPAAPDELRARGGVLGALLRASDADAAGGGGGGGAAPPPAAPWARPSAPAAAAAAALVAATDGLALGAEALRAALAPAGGGGDGGAAAGAAARSREVQAALRSEHGWLWAEVDEVAGRGELPADVAAGLRERLRLPRPPFPPEPVAPPPALRGGASWFYGGCSA